MSKVVVRMNFPDEIVERRLVYAEKVTTKNEFHVPVINDPATVRGVYLNLKKMEKKHARRTC